MVSSDHDIHDHVSGGMSDRWRTHGNTQEVLLEGDDGCDVVETVLLDHEDDGESDHIHDTDVGDSGSSTCIICD